MEAAKSRDFDLNIEKILEGWETSHAIREIIANGLDEQALTSTAELSITQDLQGNWHIRDWGRGLDYRHLTENESSEKLQNPEKVIGKFGVGLKDALATLDRHGVVVRFRSRNGDFSLKATGKHGFDDVATLNVAVSEPTDPGFVGTEFILNHVSPSDIDAAKDYFLKFSGEAILEGTSYGQILHRKTSGQARVYVTGLLVAEEENFLFSYNITSLTAAMRKALNRERTNVGRTAYSERVKAMLLASQKKEVADALTSDLARIQLGTNHDEVNWMDVAVHAGQILSASNKVIFVAPQELSPSVAERTTSADSSIEDGTSLPDPSMAGSATLAEIESNRDSLDHAVTDGYRIVAIPENVKQRLQSVSDMSGNPIKDIRTYKNEWEKSFEFTFVDEERLTGAERQVFGLRAKIAEIAGGLPTGVREIKISETMRPDLAAVNASGLRQPEAGRVIIRRSQLQSVEVFAGTFLHEITHARTGHTDLSRGFEDGLTDALGKVSALAVSLPDARKKAWWKP